MSVYRKTVDALLDSSGKSTSTKRTYGSLVASFLSKYFEHFSVLLDVKQVITDPLYSQHLADYAVSVYQSEQTRSTLFAALNAIYRTFKGEDNPIFQEFMRAAGAIVAAKYMEQSRNEKQNKAHIVFDEIEQIHSRELAQFLRFPTVRSCTDALISGLMTGVYVGTPPRRIMDYTEMKVRNINDDDNYVYQNDNGEIMLVFRKYKTAASDRAKGIMFREISFPMELEGALRFRMQQPGDFLFLTKRDEPMKAGNLHKRLKTLFGCSVDMLRQVFISQFHRGTPSIKKMENLASGMGHTVRSQMMYYTKKT